MMSEMTMAEKVAELVTKAEAEGKAVVKVMAKDSRNFGKAVSEARRLLAKYDGETKCWIVPTAMVKFVDSPQLRGYGLRRINAAGELFATSFDW